jgi:FkbM family methyltransferase
MNEFMGWWFPEGEDHFQRMLLKSVSKGGPARYQYQVRDLSLEFCTNRKTAIDIGANVGLWSRDLTAHFAQVIAFEPVPLFRECLSKNVTNANFTVYNQALGNEHTWAKMNVTLGNMGHTHIAPDSIGQGDTEIRTLDSYDFNDISYIKMDCEGFEYRVIQGAEQTIKRCRPVVVVEQKPHDAYSSDYGQYAAIDLLKSWGMVVLQQVKDDWIMGWQ